MKHRGTERGSAAVVILIVVVVLVLLGAGCVLLFGTARLTPSAAVAPPVSVHGMTVTLAEIEVTTENGRWTLRAPVEIETSRAVARVESVEAIVTRGARRAFADVSTGAPDPLPPADTGPFVLVLVVDELPGTSLPELELRLGFSFDDGTTGTHTLHRPLTIDG